MELILLDSNMKSLVYAILSISLFFVFGCQSDKTISYENIPNQPIMQSSDFNQEHYIWEIFLFPTNRTSGVQ